MIDMTMVCTGPASNKGVRLTSFLDHQDSIDVVLEVQHSFSRYGFGVPVAYDEGEKLAAV